MNAFEKAVAVSDRRKSPRQRALKKAQIVFKNGNCTMHCQIVEVSGSGAKIIPDDPFSLPEHFLLKTQDGEPRCCAVKWRNGTTIGVQYVLTQRPDDQDAENRIITFPHDPARSVEPDVIRNAIERSIEANKGNPRSAALLLACLENEATIAELFGNDAVEPLLQEVLKKVRECFRASDVIARVSDHQIGIVLPYLRSKGSTVATKKVLALGVTPLMTPNGSIDLKLAVTTVLFPDGDLSASEVIARAQANLAYKSPREVITTIRRSALRSAAS
jgi:GGDEF domain-containing protein